MNQTSDINQPFVYLTTQGRKTGKQHTVELWFAGMGDSLYLLAHEDSQWWKNIGASPKVILRIGTNTFQGHGGIVDELEDEVFTMFQKKYGKSQVNEWYGQTGNERRVVQVTIEQPSSISTG